jgi:hypothetical protein
MMRRDIATREIDCNERYGAGAAASKGEEQVKRQSAKRKWQSHSMERRT